MPPAQKKTASPAAKPSETTATPPAVQEKRSYTPRSELLDKFSGVAIRPVRESNPFAKGNVDRIPDDNPLVIAFLETYEHKLAAELDTADVDGLMSLFRKIAGERGKGVQFMVFTTGDDPVRIKKPEGINAWNDFLDGRTVTVRFRGKDKKAYSPRQPKEAVKTDGTSGQS